jgi:predicted RNase H-like nuclease
MSIILIGVDCATQPNKMGLARGKFEDGNARIEEAIIGSTVPSIPDTLAGWIDQAHPTLIAMDAPLGWPARLGQELENHEAGDPIQIEPNQLFRRETDRFIKNEIGKQPLDVGADRIARTAYAALKNLEDIRERIRQEITLAWDPGDLSGIQAIEVYPAVTLIAYGMNVPGYKKCQEARRKLLAEIGEHVGFPADTSLMEHNDDALDAAICVLAGADFLRGDVYKPPDLELVKKEGWIWVKKPNV